MGRLTNLLGALGVAATLAGLALGLPAIDRSLPAERAIRSDEPYAIGAGVTVVPPPGAALDVTGTRPGASDGTVLFRLGPVKYAIVVRPFDGDLDTAAERLRQRIVDTTGYQVTGAQLEVSTAGGLAGLQGGYTAPGRGGRYAVFVADGHTIEVTISGNDLDLGRTLPQIEASTRTLRQSDEPR
ncbi:hypothetical protein Aab01nite_55230 [Paractinoplanes abujensis]|uniref:DUF1795 domain-containing protein n=1 Tax=Paractinoplanes abujensis TaxID=882441 RepID=A0A7W7CZM4_9ACTN|nr:hypothetical protein [Actinoplanes abujensis]MBB4695946.1 hypothetical protein [Actinoplanes abujensis]GID21933.1 hypothetical protein Aab01nite_55230 [Actinoplanes abujensis]